jgi:hypothetical protein
MSVHIVVRHRVKDYKSWRPVYNKVHKDLFKPYGIKLAHVFSDLENMNEVTVIAEAKDLQSAKAFAADEKLHKAMKDSGVLGKPEIFFMKDDL